MNKQEERRQVAFHVRFSGAWSDHHYGNGGAVKFDEAVSNVGNAYNTETGIFTAPFSGTYLFLVGAMTRHDYGEVVLIKNGGTWLALTYNEQDGGASYERDTTQAAIHLQAGDQVWVQQFYGTNDYKGYWGAVFTGVLVEAD